MYSIPSASVIASMAMGVALTSIAWHPAEYFLFAGAVDGACASAARTGTHTRTHARMCACACGQGGYSSSIRSRLSSPRSVVSAHLDVCEQSCMRACVRVSGQLRACMDACKRTYSVDAHAHVSAHGRRCDEAACGTTGTRAAGTCAHTDPPTDTPAHACTRACT